MASSGGRSFLATLIGWALVILVVWFFFGWIFGALRALLRFAVILVVLGGLAALYFKLRAGD